jgi:MFS superfamily sulfate permease-like transporter
MSHSNFSLLRNFKYDIPASLVVFLVALPLCLGVASASGAPLISGLIAGAVGGIVVSLVSNSPLSVSGPAAGLTVIVLGSIQKMPTYEAFLLAIMLCGVFQVILSFLKAGIVGDYIPSAVIKGMLSAIGIILILKQIPHAFGYDKDYEGDFAFEQNDGQNTFSELWHMFDTLFTPGSIVVALTAIAILLIWETKFVKKISWLTVIPAPLLAVLAGVGLNELFKTSLPICLIGQEHLVNIPIADNFSAFLGQFKSPDFSQIGNKEVWLSAGTLAIVASLESLLSIEAVDKLDPFKRITNTNRELLAQGVGNIVAGLVGGMPVTSVIVRSSANVNSGARTKLSAILHGILLLVSVYAIPHLLNKIPLSALAGILIMTGYKLAKPQIFIRKWQKGYAHFIPFVVTIVAILLTDLLKGIVVGIAVGAYFIVRENYRSAISVTRDGNNYLIRFSKDVSFINKPAVKKALDEIEDGTSVLIDISKVSFIDLDNKEIIEDFIESAKYRNIKVEIKQRNQKIANEVI